MTRAKSSEPGAVEANSQSVRCPPGTEQSGGIRLEGDIEDPSLEPLRNMKMPLQKEIEDHEISICPQRVWCRICVLGCGEVGPRQRQDEGDPVVATISCDYYSTSNQVCGEISNEGTVVNYVLRDHIDRGMASHPVGRTCAGRSAAVWRSTPSIYSAGGAAGKEIQVIYEDGLTRSPSKMLTLNVPSGR